MSWEGKECEDCGHRLEYHGYEGCENTQETGEFCGCDTTIGGAAYMAGYSAGFAASAAQDRKARRLAGEMLARERDRK